MPGHSNPTPQGASVPPLSGADRLLLFSTTLRRKIEQRAILVDGNVDGGGSGLGLRAEAQEPRGTWLSREVLMEASFTAARDGLRARLPMDGALHPAPEVARAALERARLHASELGSGEALEGIERILAEGNGADRQRAAHARGGMPALLDLLVAEAEVPYG